MPFETTEWSMVLAAQDSDPVAARSGLERLCTRYWQPAYGFIRRLGVGVDDAEDMTQEFFARFVDKALVQRYDPARGRFRAFLQSALRSFVHDEWRHAKAVKRGGGRPLIPLDQIRAEAEHAPAAGNSTPERVFDRRWATAVLDQALKDVRREYVEGGARRFFEELKPFLTVEGDPPGYRDLAGRLGMSETALKTAVHRLRRRYRVQIRALVAQTVAEHSEIDEEMQYLLDVLLE